jgi:multicomponent Na+:H+ antiporter subunit G
MSAEMVTTVVGRVFLVRGALIIASAALGLLKLPDVYTRTSAVGTAAGLGVAFMIVGVIVFDFSALTLLKGIIAIVAQLVTSAVGSYVLARASYMTGSTPVETTVPDELAEQAGALDSDAAAS